MSNPKTCTHIKVTGVRCGSPALLGEQFCYFHQHAYRGVRRPAHSRLHPVALIESEEAIQASLMEVINGLIRNTLDVKRAELIIRALHIAVKNARRSNFERTSPMVREVPEYAAPAQAADAVVDKPEPDLPSTAAIPLQFSREEQAERTRAAKAAARAEQDRARQAAIRATLTRSAQNIPNAPVPPAQPPATTQAAVVVAGKVRVGTAAACPERSRRSCPGRAATATSERKPPLGVKQGLQEKRAAARSASAG